MKHGKPSFLSLTTKQAEELWAIKVISTQRDGIAVWSEEQLALANEILNPSDQR